MWASLRSPSARLGGSSRQPPWSDSLGLRIRSAVYHHDLEKRVQTVELWGDRQYPYFTNSLGFRDASTRDVSLDARGRRILFIGDSLTEGVGIPFDDTFVGIVQRQLGRQGIDVLNAAVMSYSPTIYYRKTKHLLEEIGLDFDELVVLLDISDIYDEAAYYSLDEHDRVHLTPSNPTRRPERGQPVNIVTRITRTVTANSVVFHFVGAVKNRLVEWRQALRRRSARERLGADVYRARWTVDEEVFADFGDLGLRAARDRMDDLLRVTRTHGVSMRVVVYPWPDQIIDDDLHSRRVEFWQTWTTANDVCFHDLFPIFIGQGRAEAMIQRHFVPGDIHWNEVGHRTVADALLSELEREDCVPEG